MSAPEAVFDPERFDRLAAATVPGYAELQDLVALAAAGDAPPGARVLDVGCGTGTGLLAVARALPAATLVACDPALPMVTTARARCAAAGIAARIVHGPVDALGEEAAFDVVVSTLVVHFVPVAQRADWLRALKSRLRSGGRLVLTALTRDAQPGANELWARLRKDYAARRGFSPDALAERQARTAAQVAPVLESELRAQLAEAGFGATIPLYQLLAVRCWLVEAATGEAARA